MSSRKFARLHNRHHPGQTLRGEKPAPKQKANDFDIAMAGLAQKDTVSLVLIPDLKKRIEELDRQEDEALGTPQQYVIRGRRREAQDMLSRWLKWSGQAGTAPDEGESQDAR